jgi:hypothetical protein
MNVGGTVASDKEIAVLEETTSTDFFGVPSSNQSMMKVEQRLTEVSVHGFTNNSRVKPAGHGNGGTFVKEHKRV